MRVDGGGVPGINSRYMVLYTGYYICFLFLCVFCIRYQGGSEHQPFSERPWGRDRGAGAGEGARALPQLQAYLRATGAVEL